MREQFFHALIPDRYLIIIALNITVYFSCADLVKICNDEQQLNSTEFCQPAIFVTSLAAVEKMRVEMPHALNRVDSMAGLSLGEFAALTAAGAMNFEDGLRLVIARGKAMQCASDCAESSMVTVLGLSQDAVKSICEEASTQDDPVTIANFVSVLGLVHFFALFLS